MYFPWVVNTKLVGRLCRCHIFETEKNDFRILHMFSSDIHTYLHNLSETAETYIPRFRPCMQVLYLNVDFQNIDFHNVNSLMIISTLFDPDISLQELGAHCRFLVIAN
jgi:hypothetical protein